MKYEIENLKNPYSLYINVELNLGTIFGYTTKLTKITGQSLSLSIIPCSCTYVFFKPFLLLSYSFDYFNAGYLLL